MVFMADITNDIRLAVESGKTALGRRSVTKSIRSNQSKLVVVASINNKENALDIEHIASLANIKVVKFEGNAVELGAVCGKPFSVAFISVIEPGNSKILESVNK
ncbi:50S ribosomal protein L30e [mine drainage metagenome]|uniref:50S ribosomal protein L30e n=1 Tax=mine drainage metagenome TaxID=410659 RepID=T1AUD9_9ZZZZ